MFSPNLALRTYLAIKHIPRDPYSVTQLFLGQDVSDVMLNSSNADPVFRSDFSIVETASDGLRRAPLGVGQFLISDKRQLICLRVSGETGDFLCVRCSRLRVLATMASNSSGSNGLVM